MQQKAANCRVTLAYSDSLLMAITINHAKTTMPNHQYPLSILFLTILTQFGSPFQSVIANSECIFCETNYEICFQGFHISVECVKVN